MKNARMVFNMDSCDIMLEHSISLFSIDSPLKYKQIVLIEIL